MQEAGFKFESRRDSGNVGKDAEGNKGNFRELLRYWAKYDSDLQNSLCNNKNNALYTSWKIQNEIVEINNSIILYRLVQR